MKKIVFIGAGSIIFVKNLIGACMLTPSLCDSEFALLDINREKLYLAEGMLKNLNRNVNGGRATVKPTKASGRRWPERILSSMPFRWADTILVSSTILRFR